MHTMSWTSHAKDIRIKEDGFIDLKQFEVGQVIEHTEVEQSWMIVDVRKQWLKLRPLYTRYEGDPCKHVRCARVTVDINFERGWWRIKE